MAKSVTEYRCLLIAPSDVEDGCRVLLDLVRDWNAHLGKELGARVELVRWRSHATPDARQPAQPTINEQIVDDCDLAVALFWSRLGTPTETAESGSVEEIERLTTAGIRVMLYFSDAAVEQAALKGDQYSRLQTYRDKMQLAAFCWSYANDDVLQRQVMLHLTSAISELRARDVGSPLPSSGRGGVITAPKPDVRVSASASIIVPRNEKLTVLAVAIQNHAPMPVHMASLSLSCADGTKMFLQKDAIGRSNSPGTIEPGKSWTFFYPLDILREVMEKTGIVSAVCPDQIGRVYSSDEQSMRRVLKQLEVRGS